MKKIFMLLLIAASVQASSLRVLLVDGTGPTTGLGHSILDELSWVQSGHTGTPQRVSVFNSGGFADEGALGSNLEWSGTTINVSSAASFASVTATGDVTAGGASLTNAAATADGALQLDGAASENAMSGLIGDTGGVTSISPNTRQLVDSEGDYTVDYQNKKLQESNVDVAAWSFTGFNLLQGVYEHNSNQGVSGTGYSGGILTSASPTFSNLTAAAFVQNGTNLLDEITDLQSASTNYATLAGENTFTETNRFNSVILGPLSPGLLTLTLTGALVFPDVNQVYTESGASDGMPVLVSADGAYEIYWSNSSGYWVLDDVGDRPVLTGNEIYITDFDFTGVFPPPADWRLASDPSDIRPLTHTAGSLPGAPPPSIDMDTATLGGTVWSVISNATTGTEIVNYQTMTDYVSNDVLRINLREPLVYDSEGSNLHFEVDISTSKDFAGALTYTTTNSVTGWSYFNGTQYADFSSAGLDPAYYGTEGLSSVVFGSPAVSGSVYVRARAWDGSDWSDYFTAYGKGTIDIGTGTGIGNGFDRDISFNEDTIYTMDDDSGANTSWNYWAVNGVKTNVGGWRQGIVGSNFVVQVCVAPGTWTNAVEYTRP